MSTELEEKTRRLQLMLEHECIGGILLNAQHNFAWLTGGGSNGIDLSRENGAASLFVRKDGKRFILANNVEMPRMLAEGVSADDFEPVVFAWQDEKETGDLVISRARALLAGNLTIATDIPMHAETNAVEGAVASCRYRLTDAEIIRYRQLGKDAGACIRKVIDNIVQGETELAIAEEMRHELAAGGMTSVVTLVAADERISQFRHPVPTANRWHKTLLLVTCAKRHGMIVSLSRMVCFGDVPDELKIKTEASAFVFACLLDATRPGATGEELYHTAAQAYSEKGYADEINRHHQGGAAGYRTRDWVAHPRSTETVRMHQAFAWNPSITGTKVEETCIAAENGVDIITASPDFPQIAVTVNGREYFSAGILSL